MDVTVIEPVTPCLQSIGLDSIISIHYYQLRTFQQIGEPAFRPEAIPNDIKTSDSCTLRAQRRVGSEDLTIDRSPWEPQHQPVLVYAN